MLLIFVVISIFLMGCDKQNKSIMENPDAVNLTEEKATEMLQKMYGMPNLKEQRVILLDNTIYAEFFFDKSAGESELDSARSFALMSFVLEKSSPYGGIPYMSLVDKAQKKLYWENTVWCIYKNNKKVFYEKYKGMELEVSDKYLKDKQ
jgi:hypothetical protein